MTTTRDKAVQIFANLIKDPYFQKTKNRSREEVVWDEAKQRARQAHNNDVALSMAASDDEFGAVKSFLTFMQKATELDFSAEAKSRMAELDDEQYAEMKGLYEAAQDTDNPQKAASAKKSLLEWVRQQNLNPGKNYRLVPLKEKAKIAEPVKPSTPKVDLPDVQVGTKISPEEERAETAAAEKRIAEVNATMNMQVGGKDEKGNIIPAQTTDSGRRVIELARGPHNPLTKTGKAVNMGRLGNIPEGYTKGIARGADDKPIYYINPDTNAPELDSKTGEKIPVVFNMPAYNTLETTGHSRHRLDRHIKKLKADAAYTRMALDAFIRNPQNMEPPGSLQASSPGEIGGNKWQGFRAYIDDITSRDEYDEIVSGSMEKMESAMRAFNQKNNLDSKARRDYEGKDKELEAYQKELTKALDIYDDALDGLEQSYEENEALEVPTSDRNYYRKATLSTEQSAQLSRLWYVQQYAKSQNLFNEDGTEITPFTDFMSRFRFSPDEFMPDKDENNEPIYTTIDGKEVAIVNGEPADEYQQADLEAVHKTSNNDVNASVHYGSDDNIQNLFTTIMHEYITPENNKLKQGSLLEAHMRKPIKTWAPFDGMVYDKKTKTYSNPPQRQKIDKSKWYGGVETFITKKVNEKVNTAKEARTARSRQTKERNLGDVIKQRFVQTFDKLKKVQANDPAGIGIDTPEAVLEAYPSAWMATSEEIEAAIQEMPGKDDEEKMENYMEARQADILKNIEDGLEDEFHPVYELMNQMRFSGRSLHERLTQVSDPDRVNWQVIEKEPEIMNRIERIPKSNPYKLWTEKTSDLSTAMEKFLKSGDSHNDLFSETLQELVAASPADKDILEKGQAAYRFMQRHLDPSVRPKLTDKDGKEIEQLPAIVPKFNLGRPRVGTSGEYRGSDINYDMPFTPDRYASVEDILEKWWKPLVSATDGGAIAKRIHAMDEWHQQWENDLKLHIIKPPTELDDQEQAQQLDADEYNRGVDREHDTDTDENILGEFKDKDAEEDKKSEGEVADDEVLRKNLQRMYEAIQENPKLASEFCGTTPDGESTGKLAVFTLDDNGVVEFHPNNFRITSEENLKKLNELLTTIGLENTAIDFTGMAKEKGFQQGKTKKLTQTALNTIMKDTLEEDQMLSLEAQIPGMDITYKQLLNSIIKQLPEQQAMSGNKFLQDVVQPLVEEASAGAVGKYKVGDEYLDELPTLPENALPEDRQLFEEQAASAGRSINESKAMQWIRRIGLESNLIFYDQENAEEIAPILFTAIQAAILQRQEAFDNKYAVKVKGKPTGSLKNEAYYIDKDGNKQEKIWEGFEGKDGIDDWIANSEEYGIFEGQLKRMFVEGTSGNRTRKNIDEYLPHWGKTLFKQFMSPNFDGDKELFPDIMIHDFSEDSIVPPEALKHILEELNSVGSGLQYFRHVSPHAGMLLNQQVFAGRGTARNTWYAAPENQAHIAQWEDLFGRDAFTTWAGHRRILSVVSHISDKINEAKARGIETPWNFKIFNNKNEIHPDVFSKLAEDVFSIPQSNREWESYDEIPPEDELLKEALGKNYHPDVLADILFGANLHALPNYSGLRLSSRDSSPDVMSDQFYDLTHALTEIAFDRIGQFTKAHIVGAGITGFEDDEMVDRELTDMRTRLEDNFETKMATQQYSTELGTPFASKSVSNADDIVSKLLQTLQEEINVIPKGSSLRELVETVDGKPGALITRMQQIRREYFGGKGELSRTAYHKNYWDAMRDNPALSEEARNTLADKWEGFQLPYDDSIKLNAAASTALALTHYGYNEYNVQELPEAQKNEINNFRELLNTTKSRIEAIDAPDFDISENPQYLTDLKMGMDDTFLDSRNRVPAFQNINQINSESIGTMWDNFNATYPDNTIANSNVIFSDALMNYLKSPYQLDEEGNPIQQLDEAGNPVTEEVTDEKTGETISQPVYESKPVRVDEDAVGDPEHHDYLKGMDEHAKSGKWGFTSRHYHDFDNPMERIREREKMVKTEEERRDALERRSEAVKPGQIARGKERIEGQIQPEDVNVAKEEKRDIENIYEGYSDGVGGENHPKTHADLLAKLIAIKGHRHDVLHPDHPDYDAESRPHLNNIGHGHLRRAGIVTDYDSPETKRWQYTEKGKQMMDSLPKVAGTKGFKAGGIVPEVWAEAIGGAFGYHGNTLLNSINAAPIETPTPPQPEVPGEGEVGPIQNMLYKMATSRTNKITPDNLAPTSEAYYALFNSLKAAMPGYTEEAFNAWIGEHGLLMHDNGWLETPFTADIQSKRRYTGEHLDFSNVMPFDFDEESESEPISSGGSVYGYMKLLGILYGSRQRYAEELEKSGVTALTKQLIDHKSDVNDRWISMLENNNNNALNHEHYTIDKTPVDYDLITANQYYHLDSAHPNFIKNKLSGRLRAWFEEDGHYVEPDGEGNHTLFPPQEEGESTDAWEARRGDGVKLDFNVISDHLKALEDGRFLKDNGTFNFQTLGHVQNRPGILNGIRELHGMEPKATVVPPPQPQPQQESDKAIAGGPVIADEDDDEGLKVKKPKGKVPPPEIVTPPVETSEVPPKKAPEFGVPQQPDVPPTGQRGMPEVGDQLPLEGFGGTPQPEDIKPSAPTGELSFRQQKIAQHLKDKGFSDKEIENYVPNFNDAEANKLFGQHLDERLKSTPDAVPAMEADKRKRYEDEIRAHSQEMHGMDIHGDSKFSDMTDKQLTDAFDKSHNDASTHRSKKAAEEKQNFANDVVTRVPPLQPDATPDTIMDRARTLMSEYLHHRHAYDKPALAHWQAQMQDMQAKASQAGLNWEDQLGTELEQFDGMEGRAMFGSPEHKAFVLQQMQGQQQQQQAQQEEQSEYDNSLDDRFAEASKHEDYHPGEFIKPMIRNDGSRNYVTHDYNSPFTGNQMSAYASNDPKVQEIMAGGDMDSFTDANGNPVAGWHHPASGSTVHPHVFEKLRSEVKSLNRNPDINTGLYIPDGSRYTNLYNPSSDEEIPAEHSLGKGSFWMGQDGNLIRLDRQAEEFDAHPHNAQHDHAPHKVVSDWHTRRIKQHLQQGGEDQFNKRVAPISTPKSERAQQAYTASQTPPERPEKAIDRFRQREEGLAPQPSFNPMDYMNNKEKMKQHFYSATDALKLKPLSNLARFVSREKPLDKYHTEQRQAFETENKVNELYQKLRSGYYGVDYTNAPEEAQKINPYATPPDVYYGDTADAKARAAYERQQMRPQQMQEAQPQPVAQGAGASPERQVQFKPQSLDLPKHWETTE